MRTTSLGQETNFTQILPLLGVTVNSTALPAIVDCPCCGSNRLHVYRDTAERQDWAYCWSCGFSGDMIELAAAAWKLDLPNAITKLRRCNLPFSSAINAPDALANYERDHVTFRKRVAEFWQSVQTHACENEGVVQTLFQAMDLPPVASDWLLRGTRFFGLSSYEMLTQYVFADRRKAGVHPSHFRRVCKLAPNTFRGNGWKHLLVMPFYNLPGRVCGILLYGLDEDGTPVPAYLPIMTVYGSTNHEAGLAMLNNMALPVHPAFADTVFAFTSPLLALKAQLGRLRGSDTPLPIVSTFVGTNAKTKEVWQNFKNRRVICWSPTTPLEAVKQAYHANAAVSLYRPQDPTLNYSLQMQSIEDSLRRVREHGISWPAALRKLLAPASRPESEAALQYIEMSQEALYQFAQGSEPELQQRLDDIRNHVGAVRQIKFGGKTICEQQNQWTFEGGELVSDAVLRIEQAIATRRQTYYRGRILFNQKEVPFFQKADTIERYGFEWLAGYLRDETKTGVMYYAPTLQKKLHAISLLFHRPEHVTGVERLGWDNDRRCFQFPTFSITDTGGIENANECLFTGVTVPGRGLVRPADRLSLDCVKQLSAQHDECGLLWATAATVVSNLIAPAIFREPKGVLLDGQGAQAIGEAVAAKLGCPELVYESPDRVSSAVQTQLDHHQWPIVLRAPLHRAIAPGRWLNTPETNRLIVSLSPATTQVLGLRRQWHIIHCPRQLGSLQLTGNSAAEFLPHYLQDLCKRRFSRDDQTVITPKDVLLDMAIWFTECGGHRQAVIEAKRFIEQADENTRLHRFFVRLVALGVVERYIRPGRADFVNVADVVYLDEEKHVWISQRAVSEFAIRHGELPLDVLLVTQVLEHAGALRGEQVRQIDRGWVVDREWWDTQWRSLAHKD